VCNDGRITLTECARRADLPASTALRLLRTLEATGFVTRDEVGIFQAGPRLVQIGARAMSRQALVRIGEPALQRIVAATGESTYLSMRGTQDTAIYVALVEGAYSVRHISWVGRSVSLDDLVVGQALRDELPDRGYVAQRDRLKPDVTTIATPIRHPGGVAGAISLLGPTYRIDDTTMSAYGAIVADEARQLTAELGAPRGQGTSI
jgi:urocanate hydratase